MPLLAASRTDAAAILVTHVEDGGLGGLRSAIEQANATEEAGTITFEDGPAGTLVLDGDEFAGTKDLTIRGPGSMHLTITAGQRSRAFRFERPDGAAANWKLQGIAVSHGLAIGTEQEDGGAPHAREHAISSARPKRSLVDSARPWRGANSLRSHP